MFKKMLTFTDLNLRILNKILRDLYGQFYALHLEVVYHLWPWRIQFSATSRTWRRAACPPPSCWRSRRSSPRSCARGPRSWRPRPWCRPASRSCSQSSRHVTSSVSPGLGVVFTLLLFSNEAEAQNRILCSSSSSYLSICHMKQVKYLMSNSICLSWRWWNC